MKSITKQYEIIRNRVESGMAIFKTQLNTAGDTLSIEALIGQEKEKAKEVLRFIAIVIEGMNSITRVPLVTPEAVHPEKPKSEAVKKAAKTEVKRRPENPKPDEVIHPESLATKRGIAEIFSVSVRTVENWMNERKIPFMKIGRSVRFVIPHCIAAIKRFETKAA